ncbi:carboxylesterase/lipase family protein [Mycobacterium sp. 29Ha]|uniref:carboxylesterase/lipase family protein n=1 Tax=Mycobacterium sp. 29Ha TaxID=2939268 RepID=UPI00293908A8|nr:carboxylesterase/lipase family protein [Mycobacterium sp. 29Ha]MDV3133373.1 carboxylesterase/lipase family protein [Mycobacterium sp. 29Ha]
MHSSAVCTAVRSGLVEGTSRDGVTRWRSIPYAQPPVGRLRLKAPQPVRPWDGVLKCHDFRYCAPQSHWYTAVGVGKFQPMSEDCLTLNVVAAEGETKSSLPVMVFIHGGGYFFGSSATPLFDGASLARRGCVFVSVNYRLGALGAADLSSLSTDESRIDDNIYLRDLVMALQWVHSNIARFGGDPDNVTIFGESAGAHAVTTLLALPAAKGLFHRAISESPAGGLASSPEQAQEHAEKFAAILGVPRQDAAAAVMKASTSELVKAFDQLLKRESREKPGAYPVGPTYGTAYLPLDPLESLQSGRAHRVPLLIGTNAEEAKLFTRVLKLLPTNEPAIEHLLANATPYDRARITAAYPTYPAVAACHQIGGDFTFGSLVWQIADARSAYAPTYVYRYDYAPRTLRWLGLGATHATELLAVFGGYQTRLGRLISAVGDKRSAERVTHDVQRRWNAFARTGTPGEDWPRYVCAERAVMIIDETSYVAHDPEASRRKAWQGVRGIP